MSNQDWALAGMLTVIFILSAFPATAKFAMFFGIFLLVLAWINAWRNGSLKQLQDALSLQIQNAMQGKGP